MRGVHKGDTRLGRGSFGVTVRRNIEGHPVAVKRVLDEDAPAEIELQAAAQAVTDNVAKLYAGCTRGKKNGLILMEPLEGPAFPTEGQPPAAIKKGLKQLLAALSALHEAGLYHIDIKKANVMFSKGLGSKIKLIDWGLACRRPFCRGKSGTAYFMPPELYLQENFLFRTAVSMSGRDLFALHDAHSVGMALTYAWACEKECETESPLHDEDWYYEFGELVESMAYTGIGFMQAYVRAISKVEDELLEPIRRLKPRRGLGWCKKVTLMLAAPNLLKRATVQQALQYVNAL